MATATAPHTYRVGGAAVYTSTLRPDGLIEKVWHASGRVQILEHDGGIWFPIPDHPDAQEGRR